MTYRLFASIRNAVLLFLHIVFVVVSEMLHFHPVNRKVDKDFEILNILPFPLPEVMSLVIPQPRSTIGAVLDFGMVNVL